MFKRVFYTGLGLGAGVVAGVSVVRKLEATRRKLTPAHLAARAGAGADSVGERARSALAEGRAAAVAREAELRAGYQHRGGPDVARAPGESARSGGPNAPGGPGARSGGSEGVAPLGGRAAEWDSPGRAAPPSGSSAAGAPDPRLDTRPGLHDR